MITFVANGRTASYTSTDVITAGSVGIPVQFTLSEDFDGLSPIVVFEGSGTAVDVALVDNACVVPHEVVATAGGYLKIGIYARNGEGTIVIPTIWGNTCPILPGAAPSDVDPSQPTPDWTAQVQQIATDAYTKAEEAEGIANNAKTAAITAQDSAQASAEAAQTAREGAEAAQGFAETAESNARGFASDAAGSAGDAAAAKTAAETAQGKAEQAQEAIEDMGVSAATLAPGTDATVTKSVDPGTGTVTLAFGIPQGAQGDTGATGATGAPGQDGVSPAVTVTDITGGHRVSITDADGTQTFDVMDGEKGQTGPAGQDGAPGVGVPTGGTDGQMLVKDGSTDYATKWANQPSVPVTDVQINGTSILQDGVANIPYGSNTTAGLVKYSMQSGDAALGIYINSSSGQISVAKAETNQIKAGSQGYKPIVPSNQHESTFYGLAKAAGSDAKNSTLPVGQYTDAAKSAIQTMLGLSAILGPVEGATASTAYQTGELFLHGGALYKATVSIASGDAIVPGTNCTQTTIIDVLKGA